jgi:hypothetical protein
MAATRPGWSIGWQQGRKYLADEALPCRSTAGRRERICETGLSWLSSDPEVLASRNPITSCLINGH